VTGGHPADGSVLLSDVHLRSFTSFFFYSMGSLPVGVRYIFNKLVLLGSVRLHSVQGASIFLAPVQQVVCPSFAQALVVKYWKQ